MPGCKERNITLTDEYYGRRLRAAARTDFKKFWSAHRWWSTGVTLAVTCAAIAVQILYQGAASLARLEQTAETGLVGLAVSLAGNWLISLWRGAVSLDAARAEESKELQAKISKLETLNKASAAELAEIRTPKRTLLEERHLNDARSALQKLAVDGVGEECRTVLCHLKKHDSMTFTQAADPQPPNGMRSQDMRGFLNLCVTENLVTKTTTNTRSGYEYVYTIAPGMKGALDELLYL